VALEEEAKLLRAATRAKLIDHDKGTAALLVYSQLRRMGAGFSFGQFLVERKLLSQMALDGLLNNVATGAATPARTISRLGDFELLELIGEGETGSVFRAHYQSQDRSVAVKILSPRLAEDPEALQRFLEEAKVCAHLKHPHIIRFLRLAKCEGLYYIAMELAEGGSLRKLLKSKGGKLDEVKALEITAQVADALSLAHGNGLLHRDVKPENILLDRIGYAKLADLGIAVRTTISGNEGEFWGTPAYLAPEIISGKSADDPRSDLYSLGATLFEMLAGRTPFTAPTPGEMFRHHLQLPPPDVRVLRPELSPQTSMLVARMLAKDPENRFPDAKSVLEAADIMLNAIRAKASMEQAVHQQPPPPQPAPARRRPAQRGRHGAAHPRGRYRH
jgi:serine/threonine-protein kinase